jgi:GT2 family glycosyltransferase
MAPPTTLLLALADVRGFRVPHSHRQRLGRVVTAAKRGLVLGSRPLLDALLGPQVRFNRALAELLAHPGSDLSRAREVLLPLADPCTWQVRFPLPGPVRAAWEQVRGLVRPLMEGQHRWNLELVDWLVEAARSWPPGSAQAARIQALEAHCEVLSTAQLPRALRLALPLWREVLRAQVDFNHTCVRILRHLCGTARPHVALPSVEQYAAWWKPHEPEEIAEAAAAVQALKQQPLISLLTPAYETPDWLLRACLGSVRAQSYPHWELCLVDDGSRSLEVQRLASQAVKEDGRIRFQRLAQNSGIARATNVALALASGSYVALLDHDDELAPHALAEVARYLEAHSEVDVLFSDEDKLDGQGQRFAPYLKPALSLDLLRAVNFVCHLLVVRTALLREIGGLRPGFEGAQDHDLLLRLVERTKRVAHLPRVLYRWRAVAGSTAVEASAKPAASEAGRRAVVEHLQRLGEAAQVEQQEPGVYRVRYALRGQPRVSLVLLHGERLRWTAQRVRTLRQRTDWPDCELLLPTGTGAQEQEAWGAGAVHPVGAAQRVGVAAEANHLMQAARGEVLVLLQAGHMPAEPEWLQELAAQALRPALGVVGAHVAAGDGTVAEAGLWLDAHGRVAPAFAGLPDPSLTALGGSHWSRNLLAVSGSCLALRRTVFEQLHGFEESFTSLWSVDLCLRAVEQGLRVLSTPYARLVREAGAGALAFSGEESERLYARHTALLKGGDPFHHPCLSVARGGVEP